MTNISISDGVEAIGKGAFQKCVGLTKVEIPESVRIIHECAFSGCSNLISLTIPDAVIEIGENAFKDVLHITYNGPAQSEDNWGALSRN